MENKFLHQLMDMVLDKEPETPVMMNVSSLAETAEVWFFEVTNDDEFHMKECYRRYGGYWEKWDKDNRVTRASEEQVLEALRNA